jgi:hypothetical protein
MNDRVDDMAQRKEMKVYKCIRHISRALRRQQLDKSRAVGELGTGSYGQQERDGVVSDIPGKPFKTPNTHQRLVTTCVVLSKSLDPRFHNFSTLLKELCVQEKSRFSPSFSAHTLPLHLICYHGR